MRSLLALVLLFCISLLLTNCSQKREGNSGSDTGAHATASAEKNTSLTIAAAASLKDAFDQIGRGFEAEHPRVKVEFSYAASNILTRQIEQGAPFDLVALAAEETMNGLDSAHLLQPGSRIIFARNRLCVLLRAGTSLTPHKLSDIADPSFKHIAVASPGVPARIYAEEALRKAELWEKLESRFVYGGNVREVMNYVRTGEADCGFVYTSDAKTSRPSLSTFVVDSTLHRPILYPAAVLKNSPAKSLAGEFIAWLQSPKGRAVLKEYGFE